MLLLESLALHVYVFVGGSTGDLLLLEENMLLTIGMGTDFHTQKMGAPLISKVLLWRPELKIKLYLQTKLDLLAMEMQSW